MAKQPQAKVIIAVPSTEHGSMNARTAHSIGCAIIGANGIVIDFLLRLSCDIVSSRTWLVNAAIKNGATHLLFVDSDMTFPDDTIPRLLAHDKEIVACEYNKREFPLKGVHEPMEDEGYDPTDDATKDKLYKAKYAGTGLMLIKLSIFEKLGLPSEEHPRGNPWFSFGRDSQGALVMGEDVWFCNVARDAGFDTWIDPSIKVGHVGEYIF